MDIEKLPVDYVQDVIDTTVTEKRRYHMITNTDGTMSLDDVTTYVLKGSEVGMDDINKTNGTVNAVIDAVKDIENGTVVVGKATNAAKAEDADHAMRADNATNATNAGQANSVNNDFILINQQVLNFENKTCTIQNEKITADSLADVYFTSDCINVAEKASIVVETYDGKLELTAGREPEGIIKASIRIRVV